MLPDKKKKGGCHVGLELLAKPHFFFDPLFMIVFLVCMIMMMWVMRGHRYGGSHALDILNERYARGEIIKPNTKSDGACCARPKDSASADRH
jgi:uncharacterized membrane protein